MAGRDVLRLANVGRMGVLWTLMLILCYARSWVRRWYRRAAPRIPVPLMPLGSAKPACIVTGASSGIGRATAAALAHQGYHVILAGRSLAKLQKVIEDLEAETRGLSLQAMELDLSSVPSILNFVRDVKSWLESTDHQYSLDLLINNAGMLAASKRCTADGFDYMMASNYFGPFILVQQLVPLLQTHSWNPRIVNVVSFTHRCVNTFQVDPNLLIQGTMQNLPPTTWYRMARIYEISKLCLVLFTYELHHRLFILPESSRISVMAADPGAVDTNILQEIPVWLKDLSSIVLRSLRLLASPAVGSASVIDAALAPNNRSGEYFFGGGGQTLPSSNLSYNPELAAKLWQTTSSLCEAVTSNHSPP